METSNKAQTQKHIRPKVRSRRQARSNQTRPPPSPPPCPAPPPPDERQDDDVNLDDLLETTRRRISEKLSFKSQSSSPPLTTPDHFPASTIEENEKNLIPQKTKPIIILSSQSQDPPSQGILRKGKYNNPSHRHDTNNNNSNSNNNDTPSSIIPSTPVINDPPEPLPPPTSSSKPSTKPFLKDLVVERRHPQPTPTPIAVVTPSSSSTTVDGYTPRTTTASTLKNTSKIRTVPELIAEHDALTRDLSQWGCTKDDDNNDKDEESPEMTLEADVSFACMSAREFDETVALEQSLALHDISAHDDDDDDNNANVFEFSSSQQQQQQQQQGPFFGRILFSDDNNNSDSNDGFDIFHTLSSDEPPALPPPPPRPFILLWTALSSWVTPSTLVAISPHVARVKPPFDDDAASSVDRREGILASLGLHLPRWLRAVVSSSSDRSSDVRGISETTVRKRWRRLVDSFDVSRNVTLEGDLWFAMTGILMGVVMRDDDDEWVGVICEVMMQEEEGLSEEECRYLMTRAIESLGRGSA